jgi:hypothetical protein
MKKYTAIVRDVNGDLIENVYFAEKAEEVKALYGYVTTTKTERVKHPSPEVMQRVLLGYQINKTVVDLAKFYADCDTVAAALKTESETTDDAKA